MKHLIITTALLLCASSYAQTNNNTVVEAEQESPKVKVEKKANKNSLKVERINRPMVRKTSVKEVSTEPKKPVQPTKK